MRKVYSESDVDAPLPIIGPYPQDDNRCGDETQALKDLIREHVMLVANEAAKHPADEALFCNLMSAGLLGLLRAVYEYFPVSFRCGFDDYAKTKIRKQIDTFLRRTNCP